MVSFQLLAKSLSGEEIARQLISVLSVQFSVSSELVVAAMRDCASANNVAMRTLKVIYPLILDVGCFSHTLDRVGEHFKVPLVNEFTTYWISLFSHSFKARLLWKERTGRSVCGYSATRWWSKWEVMNQLLELFGDLEPFLRSSEDFSVATRSKLIGILSNPQTSTVLKVELATIIDAAKPFVQATYKLEGTSDLLALECYEIVSAESAAVEQKHYPNLQAIISSISDTAVQNQLQDYASSCMKPALDYYKQHLENDMMKIPLNVFKAARLFSPSKLQQINPDIAEVEKNLSSIPFFTSADILALKDEYPQYRRISNIGGYACISTGKKYAPISEDALINEGRFFASICASVITNSGCGS